MKMLLVIFISCFSFQALSSEVTNLPKVEFSLSKANALEVMEDALLNPEKILKNFEPSGAIITKKSVDHSQIQFYAKKTVFLITKNVFIHSYFDLTANNKCANKADKGYLAKMDFSGSDDLITDNVEKYEAQLCINELNSQKIQVQVTAKLILGNYNNRVLKNIISDLIASQTDAIVQAILKTCKDKN